MKKSILLSCLVLLTLTGCSLKEVVEHGKTKCDAEYVVVSENLICRMNAEQKLSECSGHLHSIEVGYCPGGFDVCGIDENGANFCHIACAEEQAFCDFQCVSSNANDYCGARGNCNSDEETSDDYKGVKCEGSFSCVDGKCVECTSDTDCNPPENAEAVCSDHICVFNCSTGFVKTSDGRGCEPFSCTKTDISGCTPPEHSTPFCQISTCSDEDKDCVPSSVCDFFCDDGYLKSLDGLTCDAFVCDDENLTNCQKNLPDFAVASCFSNRCDYECDSLHVKLDNACVECSDDNASHCPSIANATVSCRDNKCQYTCQDGCYSWNDDSKTCAMIDENKNNVPDCYDAINCDASDVICITTADDFLHLPDYFDSNGKVKPNYEGKYSGKKEDDVTFYLMNDINLEEVVATSVDPEAKECHATKWNAPDLKNLVLKTPLDSDKRIYYQHDFNGESVNCTMNSSLWKSLDEGRISHIKIELDVAADEVHSAFVENMTNCELNDVSWKGTIEIPDKKDGSVLGGIAGKAQNTKFRRVYCDGSTIIAPQVDAVGCVVGVMSGGDFSNESDSSSGNVKNRVEKIAANRSVGGLMGELHPAAGAKSRVVVRHVQNNVDTVIGSQNVGGLLGQISDAEVTNIDNALNVVQGNQNVGGLIGNVAPVCLIHDVKNKINTGILGSKKDGQNFASSFGGLLGSVHNKIDKNTQSVLDAKVTEIYNIVQTTANDEVMVSAAYDVGGFIGGIGRNNNTEYEVSVHNVSSQMPVVMGLTNWDDVGGFIGSSYGGAKNTVRISNVTNRVKTVKNSFSAGGFIANAMFTQFENILNEFENVSCVGSCGGFISKDESCSYKNIKNTNIVHDDDNFYGVQLVYDEKKGGDLSSNFGVGGFANLIKGASTLDNIQNDIHSVVMSSKLSTNWPAAGFIARGNQFYYSNNIQFDTISVKNVTNRVDSLSSTSTSSASSSTGGFAGSARNISVQNCLNSIRSISGGFVSGFAGALSNNAEVSVIASSVEQLSFTKSFAGFCGKFGSNTDILNIMSLARRIDLSHCSQFELCAGVGFAFFEAGKENKAINNVVSLANFEGQKNKNVEISLEHVSGAIDFTGYDSKIKSDNPDDKYEFNNLVALTTFQLISNIDINIFSIINAMVSSTSFKPIDGSSIYYYATSDKVSAMPDASKCEGMCTAFPTNKSVDDIVKSMNSGVKFLIWSKGMLKLGEQNVEAPVIGVNDMKESIIGFIQPDVVIGYQEKE